MVSPQNTQSRFLSNIAITREVFAPFIFTLDCPAFLSPFSTSKSDPCIFGHILLTQILDPKAYHLGNCQRLLVRSKSQGFSFHIFLRQCVSICFKGGSQN